MLTKHNDEQVLREGEEVLVVADDHEVGDVSVDKVEHVGLVGRGVLEF